MFLDFQYCRDVASCSTQIIFFHVQ